MDEYAVLVDSVVRDALGLDGARGAAGLPSEPLTAPAVNCGKTTSCRWCGCAGYTCEHQPPWHASCGMWHFGACIGSEAGLAPKGE